GRKFESCPGRFASRRVWIWGCSTPSDPHTSTVSPRVWLPLDLLILRQGAPRSLAAHVGRAADAHQRAGSADARARARRVEGDRLALVGREATVEGDLGKGAERPARRRDGKREAQVALAAERGEHLVDGMA